MKPRLLLRCTVLILPGSKLTLVLVVKHLAHMFRDEDAIATHHDVVEIWHENLVVELFEAKNPGA